MQTSRRQFLHAGTGLAGALMLKQSVQQAAAGIAKRYSKIKPGGYLGKVQIETEISDEQVFTEGPAVDRAGNVFFTNVPVSKILKWNPRTRKLSVFRSESNKTNGLYFAPNGDLLCCEGGTGRVTQIDMRTRRVRFRAGRFNGFPFAAPNDLCLDGKGRIYFTSRPGAKDPSTGNVNAVYRVDADGKVSQLLAWPKIHMPNGIVTSPDDKTLYLIEAHPDADHNRNILAFDLAADGSLSNRRVLVDFYPGRSGDGMCIDAKGNLYVAAGLHKRRNTSETLDTKPGVHVISPKGALLDYARTPVDTITNCAFGGKDLKTLYVACGKYLLSIPTQQPGKAAYRPRA